MFAEMICTNEVNRFAEYIGTQHEGCQTADPLISHESETLTKIRLSENAAHYGYCSYGECSGAYVKRPLREFHEDPRSYWIVARFEPEPFPHPVIVLMSV